MLMSLNPDDFLKAAAHCVILDVRTPSEFTRGHIPGAFNLPLFSDEERAVVGTLYMKKGRSEAVLKGLELAGPKLASFVSQARTLGNGKRVLVHCWRGGMRSSSMAWLLNTAGIKASTLTGGYKAYRTRFRNRLQQIPWHFFVVGGPTGSGKTDVLKALAERGEQVVDLEGMAHHKGSAFGALGQEEQPTTEQFENDLHALFNEFDPSRPVWLEGESQSIGRVFIPEKLFALLQSAPLIMFELNRELRVKRLVREYGCFDSELLGESVLKIKKRMGGARTKEALEALANKDYKRVAEITLAYYDKGYTHSLSQRSVAVFELKPDRDDPRASAEQLLRWSSSFNFEDYAVE